MKKILLLACMFAGTMWAANPMVRVYNQMEGGYYILDQEDNLVGFCTSGMLTTECEAFQRIKDLSGMDVQIMDHSLPQEITTKYAIVDSVGPLLDSIAYNQTNPYNLHCPIDNVHNNKRCVTGCVATAMAMIMAYYEWPKVCLDKQVSYQSSRKTSDDKVVKVDVAYDYRGHQFDWDNILHVYRNTATQDQKDAVADLMYACGAAANMQYSADESSSNLENALVAFTDFFNYNPDMVIEEREKELKADEFVTALMDEFDAGRPVYATGTTTEPGLDGGHAFIIDGYGLREGDTKRQVPYFHFNWGWGGTDQKGDKNLWYMMSGTYDLSPYLSNLRILRNLKPNDGTALEESAADEMLRDNKVYDMMGREVSETIPGVLYIRNGEKFIAR